MLDHLLSRISGFVGHSAKRQSAKRAALALLLLANTDAAPTSTPQRAPTPATISALLAAETRGYGADLPFMEHEVENAVTNGRVIGSSRDFTTLAADASGQLAVLLDRTGQYVEFTLDAPADALVVRYAIPDGPAGQGLDATLGVHVDRARIGSLALTSRYG